MSTNIAEISERFPREMKKGNVNSVMKILTDNIKKRDFTLNRANIKSTKIKTPRRERSISRNIANRYTRNNPSY